MTDSIPTLRLELQAALDILNPEIMGLGVLAIAPLSASNIQIISAQLTDRKRRHDLIIALQASLDALNEDGYPALPAISITQPLYDELTQMNVSIENAVGIFEAGATAVGLDIPKAVSTPQPVPPT